MGDRIDELFHQWVELGGSVLVSEREPSIPVRSPEALIAESTAYCRESGRLTWVVLDWMLGHIDEINEERLLGETKAHGDQSVLGVLCDAAYQRHPHEKLDRIMRACHPNKELEIFFYRTAQSPLASAYAREHAIDVFRRWNYLSNELRYLQDG